MGGKEIRLLLGIWSGCSGRASSRATLANFSSCSRSLWNKDMNNLYKSDPGTLKPLIENREVQLSISSINFRNIIGILKSLENDKMGGKFLKQMLVFII